MYYAAYEEFPSVANLPADSASALLQARYQIEWCVGEGIDCGQKAG